MGNSDKGRRRPDYSWAICFSGLLVYFCTCGMPVSGFTPFLPFIAEQGYQGTLLSSLITIRCLISFLTLFFVEAFYKKISLRLGLSFSCFLIGAASILMSFSQCFAVYVIGIILYGIAYGLGTVIPIAMLMNRWFVRRRVTAIAIATTGSSICSTLLPPFVTRIATDFSLSAAFRTTGLIAWCIAGLVYLLVRNNPAEKGLSPFGAEEKTDNAAGNSPESAVTVTLEGKAVLFLLIGIGLLGGFSMASSTHFSLLFTTAGYSKEAAAIALSAESAMLAVSKLFFGGVTDRIGGKKSSLLFLSSLLCGSVFACLCSFGAFFMYAGMLLIGIGFPPSTIGPAVWAGDLANKKDSTRFLKNLQSAYTFGGILISSLPGWFYDLTGSYIPGYIVLTLLLTVFIVSLLSAYRTCARRNRDSGAFTK